MGESNMINNKLVDRTQLCDEGRANYHSRNVSLSIKVKQFHQFDHLGRGKLSVRWVPTEVV